jgi:pyruvate/2-oxoglutarate dehydrogenase complex dihydrolipoamide dehydrogenase (E3) component
VFLVGWVFDPSLTCCGEGRRSSWREEEATTQAATCEGRVRDPSYVKKEVGMAIENYRNLVIGSFTDPELAHVGLHESEVRAKKMSYRVSKPPMAE